MLIFEQRRTFAVRIFPKATPGNIEVSFNLI
jgi:hypothetical protein